MTQIPDRSLADQIDAAYDEMMLERLSAVLSRLDARRKKVERWREVARKSHLRRYEGSGVTPAQTVKAVAFCGAMALIAVIVLVKAVLG